MMLIIPMMNYLMESWSERRKLVADWRLQEYIRECNFNMFMDIKNMNQCILTVIIEFVTNRFF